MNQPINTPVDPMAGATVAAPQPPQPPMPPMQPVAPVMQDGGMMQPVNNNGWSGFFRTLNWVEIGFMTLGTAAFFTMIYYYKHTLNKGKESARKMQIEIDELSAKVKKLEQPKKQPQRSTRFN